MDKQKALGVGKKVLLSSLIRYGYQLKSVVPNQADTASREETVGGGLIPATAMNG